MIAVKRDYRRECLSHHQSVVYFNGPRCASVVGQYNDVDVRSALRRASGSIDRNVLQGFSPYAIVHKTLRWRTASSRAAIMARLLF